MQEQHQNQHPTSSTGGSTIPPLFQGLEICLSGFAAFEKTQLTTFIQERGGFVSGALEESCDVLICRTGGSHKSQTALAAGIPTVKVTWVRDSIAQGALIGGTIVVVDAVDLDAAVAVGDGNGDTLVPKKKRVERLRVDRNSPPLQPYLVGPLYGYTLSTTGFSMSDMKEIQATVEERLGGEFSRSLDRSYILLIPKAIDLHQDRSTLSAKIVFALEPLNNVHMVTEEFLELMDDPQNKWSVLHAAAQANPLRAAPTNKKINPEAAVAQQNAPKRQTNPQQQQQPSQAVDESRRRMLRRQQQTAWAEDRSQQAAPLLHPGDISVCCVGLTNSETKEARVLLLGTGIFRRVPLVTPNTSYVVVGSAFDQKGLFSLKKLLVEQMGLPPSKVVSFDWLRHVRESIQEFRMGRIKQMKMDGQQGGGKMLTEAVPVFMLPQTTSMQPGGTTLDYVYQWPTATQHTTSGGGVAPDRPVEPPSAVALATASQLASRLPSPVTANAPSGYPAPEELMRLAKTMGTGQAPRGSGVGVGGSPVMGNAPPLPQPANAPQPQQPNEQVSSESPTPPPPPSAAAQAVAAAAVTAERHKHETLQLNKEPLIQSLVQRIPQEKVPVFKDIVFVIQESFNDESKRLAKTMILWGCGTVKTAGEAATAGGEDGQPRQFLVVPHAKQRKWAVLRAAGGALQEQQPQPGDGGQPSSDTHKPESVTTEWLFACLANLRLVDSNVSFAFTKTIHRVLDVDQALAACKMAAKRASERRSALAKQKQAQGLAGRNMLAGEDPHDVAVLPPSLFIRPDKKQHAKPKGEGVVITFALPTPTDSEGEVLHLTDALKNLIESLGGKVVQYLRPSTSTHVVSAPHLARLARTLPNDQKVQNVEALDNLPKHLDGNSHHHHSLRRRSTQTQQQSQKHPESETTSSSSDIALLNNPVSVVEAAWTATQLPQHMGLLQVVSEDWLEISIAEGYFVEETPFLLTQQGTTLADQGEKMTKAKIAEVNATAGSGEIPSSRLAAAPNGRDRGTSGGKRDTVAAFVSDVAKLHDVQKNQSVSSKANKPQDAVANKLQSALDSINRLAAEGDDASKFVVPADVEEEDGGHPPPPPPVRMADNPQVPAVVEDDQDVTIVKCTSATSHVVNCSPASFELRLYLLSTIPNREECCKTIETLTAHVVQENLKRSNEANGHSAPPQLLRTGMVTREAVQATAIICDEIRLRESVLIGCAGGMLFITPDYITRSAEAGEFLDPHGFEWSREAAKQVFADQIKEKAGKDAPGTAEEKRKLHGKLKRDADTAMKLVAGAALWRKRRLSDNRQPFQHCNIVLFKLGNEDAIRLILAQGGGSVVDVSEPPQTVAALIDAATMMHATHIFMNLTDWEANSAAFLSEMARRSASPLHSNGGKNGFVVVSPDWVRDVLIESHQGGEDRLGKRVLHRFPSQV